MSRGDAIGYGSLRVTKIILYGSLFVCVALVVLLTVYDLSIITHIRTRTLIGFLVIIFLSIAVILLKYGHIKITKLMLIALYVAVTLTTLLLWGLNSSAGIFSASFVIILASILMGSRAIIPSSIVVIAILIFVQSLHNLHIVTPDIKELAKPATFFDVFTYTVILGIFALIALISGRQLESSINRAKSAENALRKQKKNLAVQLKLEKSRLKQAQLQEVEQLYQFAALGQNTAATLHELANYLSVLNIDIGDIKSKYQTSKAITNAENSLQQVNSAIKQVKLRLNQVSQRVLYDPEQIIRQSLDSYEAKFHKSHIKVVLALQGVQNTKLLGDPACLTQVLSIIFNNSIDAMRGIDKPIIKIATKTYSKTLAIIISDTGPGITKKTQNNLFSPVKSLKPTGMGVGLYIAKHMLKTQLDGSIRYVNQSTGAKFEIKINLPRN